jgi:hypothetical protein
LGFPSSIMVILLSQAAPSRYQAEIQETPGQVRAFPGWSEPVGRPCMEAPQRL